MKTIRQGGRNTQNMSVGGKVTLSPRGDRAFITVKSMYDKDMAVTELSIQELYILGNLIQDALRQCAKAVSPKPPNHPGNQSCEP